MGFESRGEAVVAALDAAELKLVYRVLHSRLADHPELMDTEFLMGLQEYLQSQAKADGVDISDHGAWDVWLGNAGGASCETRMHGRRTIDPNR